MARHDINIYRQVDDGVGYGPLATTQTFYEGEVLALSGGSVAEAATNPASVLGISIASSQGMNAVGELGTLADQVRPTGTIIQFYKPIEGQLFTTTNYAEDAAGTAVVPLISDVGNTAGFTLTGGGAWFVDTGVANHHVEIVAVIDSNGAPLGDTTIRTVGAGVAVVFGFLK
jgi:hypothetical protein